MSHTTNQYMTFEQARIAYPLNNMLDIFRKVLHKLKYVKDFSFLKLKITWSFLMCVFVYPLVFLMWKSLVEYLQILYGTLVGYTMSNYIC